MRTLKVVSIVSVLLLLTSPLHAAELSGVVVDKSSGQLLVGANVLLAPSEGRQGVTTDAEGHFHFTGLEGDSEYILSASYLGYRVKKLEVVPGETLRVALQPLILQGDEVVYTATRASEGETPSSFSNLSGEEIREQYWAQDLPPLLSNLPGVFAYSEAGNGIGYTYLKVRGFDQKRVGVTVNNIPLNDPEDGVVYWVDIPDLAANLQDVQLQRGVGYSNRGSSGGFGGSLNLVTATPGIDDPGFELTGGYGSYNTRKWSAAYNSGIVDNTYGFYGRFSRILSDGYRERSASDLWSYFLTGVRYGLNTRLTLNVYGGIEETQAAWDAAPESALETDRRYNPITYPNTIDWFTQPHYELHHEWQPNDSWVVENSLFYIHGEGYYEQYKADRDLVDFGMQPFTLDGSLIETTDLVNQKWVYKDHYGWAPRARLDHQRGTLQFGGDWQYYEGKHEGFVLWANEMPEDASPRNRYYHYFGEVQKGGAFAREAYEITSRLRGVADLELRMQRYAFKQFKEGSFTGDQVNRYTVDHTFLNPKLGLHYRVSDELTTYLTLGQSQRAPVNDEYWDTWEGPDDLGADPLFATSDTAHSGGNITYVEWSDPSIEPERVLNLELGTSWSSGDFQAKLNGYWMDFHNEIVPAGGVRDGAPVSDNADRSVHSGIEFESSYRPQKGFTGYLNLTLSHDELLDYTVNEAVYDDEWNLLGVEQVDLSGNRVALFPSAMASLGIGYTYGPLSVSVDTRHVGKQYLDNTQNEERTIDPFTLVGLRVSANLPHLLPDALLALDLQVNNLLDTEYETSGYRYGENYYYVGAPRNVYLSLRVKL